MKVNYTIVGSFYRKELPNDIGIVLKEHCRYFINIDDLLHEHRFMIYEIREVPELAKNSSHYQLQCYTSTFGWVYCTNTNYKLLELI